MTLNPKNAAQSQARGRHRASAHRPGSHRKAASHRRSSRHRKPALSTGVIAGLALTVTIAMTSGVASATVSGHHTATQHPSGHSAAPTASSTTAARTHAAAAAASSTSTSSPAGTATSSPASTAATAASGSTHRSASPTSRTSHSAQSGASQSPSSNGTSSGGTIFGTTIQSDGQSFEAAFNRQNSTFGGLKVYRVFYNGAPSPWPGHAGYGNRPVVVSFEVPPSTILSGADDTAIRNWFRTAPRSFPIYYIYFHEPENNMERGQFSSAQYKAAWQHVRNLQRQSGRMDLKATLNLMCWTAGNSGRDWHNYWPGSDVVDLVAFDCYNAGRKNKDGQRYEPAANMFTKAAALAHTMGKPWAVAEVGSPRLAGDSSGSGRAAWLRGVADFLRSHGAVFATYFDSRMSSSLDFRLTDAPSKAAWRSAVTS